MRHSIELYANKKDLRPLHFAVDFVPTNLLLFILVVVVRSAFEQ